jgi:tRNA pseudouridine38-40 synthase
VRIGLLIEYDGTDYAGWQRQKNAQTIQQTLEECIASLTGRPVLLTGSGRTDAGVHAYGQVAHFDDGSSIPPERFAYAMNSKLPPGIKILRSGRVAEDFHARFSAKRKTYRYAVCNSLQGKAIGRQYFFHVPAKLDEERMRQAAAHYMGRQDFAAFMAQGSPVRSTVREVYESRVCRVGDEVYFEVCANGFLYNMVRIMAGTLIRVGLHKIGPEHVLDILAGGARKEAGFTAPPQGLALLRVDYGYDIFMR